MPTGPARSGRPDDKLRMVEGAAESTIVRAPKRDAWLKGQGITVVRIPVVDLKDRFDETPDAIARMAEDLL
jgi:hypothetical protein